MSRFDMDSEYEGPLTSEMWWHTVEQALTGRRGLAALRELEQALLALPEHKLIEGVVAEALPGHERFSVCAIGAFAWHRKVRAGLDPVDAAIAVERETRGLEEEWETTQYAEAHLDLRSRFAWAVAYENDEGSWNLTDEQRYEHVLAWTREQIAKAEGVQAQRAARRERVTT